MPMAATGLVPAEPRLTARRTIVAPRGQAPRRRLLLDATDLAASHQSTGTSPAVPVVLPNRARSYSIGACRLAARLRRARAANLHALASVHRDWLACRLDRKHWKRSLGCRPIISATWPMVCCASRLPVS